MSYPETVEGLQAADARWHELFTKKFQNCDPQGNGGLSDEEQSEMDGIVLWKNNVMLGLMSQLRPLLTLKKGDLVEATFEDGNIYARISEEYNGGSYHIETIEGGGGCTIKPWRVRKLSELEVFNLKVNDA